MTKISWCDETINPVVGCSKISAGCQNCYAENMARRLAAMGLPQYEQTVEYGFKGKDFLPSFMGWNGKTAFVESEIHKPFKWKKPRTIFVSSMGDLFHESVNLRWQITVLDMVKMCPQHTFIFLTKRPENMRLVVSAYALEQDEILANLVLGVSVEDQKTADERIPVLLRTPAVKRFISLEPMVVPVDLLKYLYVPKGQIKATGFFLPGIESVILGGESGPKARPLDPAWVRVVRDQCQAAGVPFMFKQWGKNVVSEHGRPWEYNNDAGFPILDGCAHTELPWEVRK